MAKKKTRQELMDVIGRAEQELKELEQEELSAYGKAVKDVFKNEVANMTGSQVKAFLMELKKLRDNANKPVDSVHQTSQF